MNRRALLLGGLAGACAPLTRGGAVKGGRRMDGERVRIGIVATGRSVTPEAMEKVRMLSARLYGDRVDMVVHPQVYLTSGHFAGVDEARAAAFVQYANDPALDAVWFARGGYGTGRIVEAVLPRLTDVARRKAYLGYSDAGVMLAALHRAGFEGVAHGPMPYDVERPGGEAAVARALAWLVDRDGGALEPSLAADGRPAMAFNLSILSTLIGTPWQPDLGGRVLMVEEVTEAVYRIDRMLLHVTSNPGVRRAAGFRLGRCSLIPANDPEFGQDEEAVARFWCERSGIPWLGRADIGHDVDNRVVPFGAVSDAARG